MICQLDKFQVRLMSDYKSLLESNYCIVKYLRQSQGYCYFHVSIVTLLRQPGKIRVTKTPESSQLNIKITFKNY